MCDFDDFEEGFMDEDLMPEHDDVFDFDHSEEENIHDESDYFPPSEESEIDMRQTAILGGMVFGLAYEDALDRRDAIKPKKKK